MNHIWELQEAKNRFSNLVERAQHEGPQIVTNHGKKVVVVMSADDYRKMNRPNTTLLEFMQKSPLSGIDIDISRDKNVPRGVEM